MSERESIPIVHPDVVAGGALLAFCVAAWHQTTRFPEVPAMLSQNIPPTFFPRLVLVAIAAMSLALIVAGLRGAREPRPAVPARVLVTAILLAATIVLVRPLGLLGAIFVASLALPLYWGERRPLRVALLALGLPAAIHVVFVLALGMRLPPGALW